MKKAHLALSLLALSFLAACGGAAAASAAGVYEVDKVALKATMLASMSAEQQKDPKSQEMIDGILKDMVMTIDLKADGTAAMTMKMTMMGQTMENPASGTWKLEGGKLTMNTKDKDGKEETKTVDYANGSFMVEQEAGGQKAKVTFKRK